MKARERKKEGEREAESKGVGRSERTNKWGGDAPAQPKASFLVPIQGVSWKSRKVQFFANPLENYLWHLISFLSIKLPQTKYFC